MRLPHSRTIRRGVTLTEILVVIGVICILAALSNTFIYVGLNAAKRYEVMAQDAAKQDAKKKPLAQTAQPVAIQHTPLPFIPVPAPNPAPVPPPVEKPINRAGPQPPNQVDAPAVPGEYIVEFQPSINEPKAEAARMAATYQGKVLKTFSKIKIAAAFKIPDEQVEAFKADKAIASLTKNYLVHNRQQKPSTGYRRMFSYPTVPAHQLVLLRPTLISPDRNAFFGNTTFGAPSINIAIMDGGVDINHPDLNVVRSVAFGGIPSAQDQDGHGTHCAGIAAARNNNKGVVGVYPGAPIWNLRVLDASGSGTLLGILDALFFVFSHANEIQVCNLSFGPPIIVPIMDLFVDACALNGVVMVCAAGNDGKLASSSSPGSSNFIVNVGALADSDGRPGKLGKPTLDGPDDTMAIFSDWDFAVTVLAPGVDILSTDLGGGYALKTGTSMSSPHVAGAIALLMDPKTNFGKNQRNLIVPRRPPIARDMAKFVRSISTEIIPGILGDTTQYRLVNFKLQ
jgi:prepilin-type N-terminal cleavage/methylation domain-containing protein